MREVELDLDLKGEQEGTGSGMVMEPMETRCEGDGSNRSNQDFWVVWQMVQPKLMSRCLQLLNGNREDAEDVLHDCMLKAHHYMTEAGGASRDGSAIRNMEAWLTRLVYNHCIDLFRNRKSVPVLDQDSWFWEKLDQGNGLTRPDKRLMQMEETQLLLIFVAELPPKLRVPFVLHFLDDQSYANISKECGLTVENVRKRIQLARAEIKGKLAEVVRNKRPAPKPTNHVISALKAPVENMEKVVDPVHMNTVRVTSVCFPKGIVFYAHLFHGDYVTDLSLEKEQRLKKYVSRHPGGWKKRLELGRILELRGDWPQAVTHYQTVLKKRPDQMAVSWHLAYLLKLTGEDLSAGNVLTAAAEHISPIPHRLVFQGWGAYLQGDVDQGEALLREAVRKGPDLSFCSYGLGLFLFWQCRNEEAFSCLVETVKVAPKHLPALSLLIEILKVQGRKDLLSVYLDMVLSIQPDHVPTLKYRLDASWEESGISHKTLEQLNHLSKLVPGSIMYLESLATYHRIRGEEAAVVGIWENFVNENPRHPGGWFRLAREQFRGGRKKGAHSSLARAGNLVRMAIGDHYSPPGNEQELEAALRTSPLLPQSICYC